MGVTRLFRRNLIYVLCSVIFAEVDLRQHSIMYVSICTELLRIPEDAVIPGCQSQPRGPEESVSGPPLTSAPYKYSSQVGSSYSKQPIFSDALKPQQREKQLLSTTTNYYYVHVVKHVAFRAHIENWCQIRNSHRVASVLASHRGLSDDLQSFEVMAD